MRSESPPTGVLAFQPGPGGGRPGRRARRAAGAQISPLGALGELRRSLVVDPSVAAEEDAEEVQKPAVDLSELLHLEEDAEECMSGDPMHVCFLRYGSYGIKRLHTEDWDDLVKLNYLRPDWMAHEKVQQKALFDVTFPGTHDSGTFDFRARGTHQWLGKGTAFGIQTQHLDIMMQLELGIRAFDFRVLYEEDRIFLSHGICTVPLGEAVANMSSFLQAHPKEIILIYAKVDKMSVDFINSSPGMSQEHYRQPFVEEEADPTKVPGQMVHDLMREYFSGGNRPAIMTYSNLALASPGQMANPLVSDLVAANVRVMYFWEKQQVLCTSLDECKQTPGWTRTWHEFVFGWPLDPGLRQDPGGRPVVEPACLADSWEVTKSAHPDHVVKNLKQYSADLQSSVVTNGPTCLPEEGIIPSVHQPTLIHNMDAILTINENDNQHVRQLIGNANAIFTRGEGFNVKSGAERVNYLLLVWYLKKGLRELYTQPNIIHHDFTSPIIVHRIIEANQEVQECDYALYCKATGSCWAQSLYVPGQSECKSTAQALDELKTHADSKSINTMPMIIFCLIIAAAVVIFIGCACGRIPRRMWLPIVWAFAWSVGGWMLFVLAKHWGYAVLLTWRVFTWMLGDLLSALSVLQKLYSWVDYAFSFFCPRSADGPHGPTLPAAWYYCGLGIQSVAFSALYFEIFKFDVDHADKYLGMYGGILAFWWAGVGGRLHLGYYSGESLAENLTTLLPHSAAVFLLCGTVVTAPHPPFASLSVKVGGLVVAAIAGVVAAPRLLGRMEVQPAKRAGPLPEAVPTAPAPAAAQEGLTVTIVNGQ